MSRTPRPDATMAVAEDATSVAKADARDVLAVAKADAAVAAAEDVQVCVPGHATILAKELAKELAQDHVVVLAVVHAHG